MKRTCHYFACLTMAVVCLAIASCSEEQRLDLSEATLEGSVSYQGKPVPYALIIAVSADGEYSSTGNADRNAKYKLGHVPVGSIKIGVNTEAGQGFMMRDVTANKQGGGVKPAKFIAVPKEFHRPETSGITTTIADGPNTFDIEVK